MSKKSKPKKNKPAISLDDLPTDDAEATAVKGGDGSKRTAPLALKPAAALSAAASLPKAIAVPTKLDKGINQ